MSRKRNETETTTTENGHEQVAGDQLASVLGGVKESKSAKFKRLASRRVSKALQQLIYVRNLSNANQYEYTPEQVRAIHSALSAAVNKIAYAFEGKKESKVTFTLD
jgi:hypothetical protein